MDIHQLDHQQVLRLLPDRDPDGHKGSFGKILLICGSRGYTGAAALAAMGALRSGAGLVYLAVPESIYAIEAVKLTEPVIIPMEEQNGMLGQSAAQTVAQLLPRMDAVLIGPGIGIGNGPEQVLRTVLLRAKCPVVVDADGITLLAAHKDILRGRSCPVILTPHTGEFIRLAGPVEPDRITAAMNLACELSVVVLLKGRGTVITDGRSCYRNPTGNPGMAVGGSGDLLAGILTSLLGQGIAPLEAAAAAAWIHGAAGDLCAQELGQYAMIPSDLLEKLPRLLK